MAYDKPREVVSSGVNNEGNHWTKHDYGSNVANQNTYHYSNRDGSYYYSNPDGSTYYNNGQGDAIYTPRESEPRYIEGTKAERSSQS